MVGNTVKIRLLGGLFSCLRPIARLLLRSGVGYREFSDVCKKSFVDVAISDFGIRGRPTNISRVAAMTGLTRKEVRSLRDSIAKNGVSMDQRRNTLVDVLHYWHTDSRYLDEDGTPKLLRLSGNFPSFADLVRTSGGDIPPGAVRSELMRIGAVSEDDEGRMQVLRRDFIPDSVDDRLLEGVEYGLRMLCATIAYNTDPAIQGRSRFQRVVTVRVANAAVAGDIEMHVQKVLGELSVELDDYMSRFAVDNASGSEGIETGVGLYYYSQDK